MKLSIIIPAHNEQNRIGKTLDAYYDYFEKQPIEYEFVVVLNGCSDKTLQVVHARQNKIANLVIIDLPTAGKGIAIKAGFANALTRDNDLIGFVDADMATKPEYFNDLVKCIGDYDGVIASRYMKESHVYPQRPAYKEWGRRLIYQPLVWLLFGLNLNDYQCGAKVFKRRVIETITPQLSVKQWAFDVDLLYICKINDFKILEVPTTWYDQAESKLTLRGGLRMLASLFKVRLKHSWAYKKFCKE